MHNKGLEGKEKREGKEEKNEGIGEGRKEGKGWSELK